MNNNNNNNNNSNSNVELIDYSRILPNYFQEPPIDRISLEKILYPIKPRDLSLYWTALTHVSIETLIQQYDNPHPFYINGHSLFGKNYEKLEFLGDSIIHCSLATMLIRMYPDKDEGFLSRVRINIERKSGLANLCNQIGLSKYIKKHPELNLTESILENVFEGFIGALYEDQQKFLYNGVQRSSEFILRVLRSTFDNIHNDLRFDDNYKDLLLRLYDKKVFESIEWCYTVVGSDNQNNNNNNHNNQNNQNNNNQQQRTNYRPSNLHQVELICKYVENKINHIRVNGYLQLDNNTMLSIPSTQIKTKNIFQIGKNKREAEQLAAQKLIQFLRIRVKHL